MKRRIAEMSGHTSDKDTPPAAQGSPLSSAGILGALLLMLPATGQSSAIDTPYQPDKASMNQRSATERFAEIQARLLKLCGEKNEYAALDEQFRQSVSQWANWSDWRNY